jgi:hypothetical protein
VSLLHAEFLKLSRRRLYLVMILILAALVGLLAVLFVIFPQVLPEVAAEGDLPVIEKPGAYLFGAQQVAGQTWFPLILAVVMLGSEFGSTVWATALSRDSRRLPQIGARFGVLTGAAWLAIVLGIVGWAVVTFFVAPGDGGPDLTDWLGLVWKVGLIELAWTAIGLGAGHVALGGTGHRRRSRLLFHRLDPHPVDPVPERLAVRCHQRPVPDQHPRRLRSPVRR